MEKETYSGTYYSVDTHNGTFFIPADVCGILSASFFSKEDNDDVEVTMDNDVMYTLPDSGCDDEEWEIWRSWCRQLNDYVPGRDRILSITQHEGELYRLSAHGYMDCTDWTTDPDSPEFDEDMEEDNEDSI